MRLLIDTNVFLWTAFEPGKLSPLAREALADLANEVMVSSVIPFELGIAAAKGRLALGEPVMDFFTARLRSFEGARELPFTVRHALTAAGLPYSLRDPMDRMLAAQAITERLPLVTSDRLIAGLGVDVIW